jgi:hypothetical protein
MMFDLSAAGGLTAWSLSPCKARRNVMAGRLSRKCGLLDGNFFGVGLLCHSGVDVKESDYTTDVEFTWRSWT